MVAVFSIVESSVNFTYSTVALGASVGQSFRERRQTYHTWGRKRTCLALNTPGTTETDWLGKARCLPLITSSLLCTSNKLDFSELGCNIASVDHSSSTHYKGCGSSTHQKVACTLYGYCYFFRLLSIPSYRYRYIAHCSQKSEV